MQSEAQRNRERKELEDRIAVRRSVLEQKVKIFLTFSSSYLLLLLIKSIFFFNFQMDQETQQFLQERSERIRLLHERQHRELEQFDEESDKLGFR